MNISRLIQVICVSFLILIILGCARVRVQKIPTPSQYIEWNDEMQQAADEITGVRFYLPRPFVNVFESFPIRTDLYYANGNVSPDGRYIIVEKIFDLEGNTVNELSAMDIPNRIVFRPGGLSKRIEAQSETEAELEKSTLERVESLEDKLKKLETREVGEEDQRTTVTEQPQGIKELRVTNAPNAYSYQPMRGNFDLLYLPDFEEQYALRVSGGLGRAKAVMAMGQGWSLQGLEATADNNALAKRLFGLIDMATELAHGAAKTAMGLPPGVSSLIQPQAAEEAMKGVPETPVTLKITVLHYATKGLYPVLKPREVQFRKLDDLSGTASRTIMNAPYIVTADLGAAERAVDFHTKIEKIGTVTIPMYPYQYVSFNTFRYLAVEVLSPDSPFLGLYDKTGTIGDPGDRQYADLGNLISDLIQGQDKPPEGSVNQDQLDKLANDVKETLEGNEELSEFKISAVKLRLQGKTVKPTINLKARGTNEELFRTNANTVIKKLHDDSFPDLVLEEVQLVDE